MPTPAPKPLDSVIERLAVLGGTGKKPGKLERYRVEKQLNDCRGSDPVNAFMGLAILATLDNDEAMMRKYFKTAMAYDKSCPQVWSNYGLSLITIGCPDEAAKAFSHALDCGAAAKPLLDAIAFSAITLDDGELMLKTLELANKLQCSGENIELLKIFTGAALEDDETAAEILDSHFSHEYLKANSVPVSDEEWDEMRALAEELKKHI